MFHSCKEVRPVGEMLLELMTESLDLMEYITPAPGEDISNVKSKGDCVVDSDVTMN